MPELGILSFLPSWPSKQTQISILLSFFCQPDQVCVLPTVQRSGSHQSQILWQKIWYFIHIFGFQTIQSNLQQRSPWPPDGPVCCREGPHHPLCLVRYCNPTTINLFTLTSKALNTYLTSPLESETRVWNGAVIGVAILVGVLDALVNGSDASKRPEVRPVLCQIICFYINVHLEIRLEYPSSS